MILIKMTKTYFYFWLSVKENYNKAIDMTEFAVFMNFYEVKYILKQTKIISYNDHFFSLKTLRSCYDEFIFLK